MDTKGSYFFIYPPEEMEEAEISVFCPECEEEAEKLYILGNNILGCNNCITEVDAVEYFLENREEF